ncbi:TspO/MBR family protein [Francisella salimarina]|uniref:TspO/MBR family protein n=1 Tax=Francisella salimarina TaxID=2599927 RepID=UPI003D817AD4
MCVGALTSTNIPTWFVKLEHPFFAPPNWLFAPVWTVLYIMIAVSGWIVFKQKPLREKNFIIYVIQLGLNFLWSFIFFCWQNIDLALIEMSILWVLIAWNLKVFLDINKIAGYLLIPYLLWVGFAWILNLNYAMLN